MDETLNERMETGSVVEVHADGTVTAATGQYAPSLWDDELDSSDWQFFSAGYTGQYSYNGPIMHNSEYIGGRLERDILGQPGYYVAIESRYTHSADCPQPQTGHEPNDTCEGYEGDYWEGWAVVFKPSPESEGSAHGEGLDY